MYELSDDEEEDCIRPIKQKFPTWEDEYAHLQKFKNKKIVKDLKDKFDVNFMDLRCLYPGSIKESHPMYWSFKMGNRIFKYFNDEWVEDTLTNELDNKSKILFNQMFNINFDILTQLPSVIDDELLFIDHFKTKTMYTYNIKTKKWKNSSIV